MKYYYSKCDDGIYKKVSKGNNMDSVIQDQNKIIVIDDQPLFHVLTYDNSICDEEKRILDYPELVEHLQANCKNVYFFNINKYLPTYVINDVNTRKEQTKVDVPNMEESMYTINNGHIVKLNAYVDRIIVKNAIEDLYTKMYLDRDTDFKRVSLEQLINDQTLLELYNLPYIEKYSSFMVPNYSYTHPSLFYILNGIYSKPGDRINLNDQNIRDLYIESFSDDKRIVDPILQNIETEEKQRYSLKEFSNSLDYIEKVKYQENDYTQGLEKAKRILTKAKKNQELFKKLNIPNKEKEKVLEKKPITK